MPVSRESSVSSSSGVSGIKASIRIGQGSQVCADAELRGEIVIGPRCFIHPKARVLAHAGPILIGEGNVIEEQSLIINQLDPNEPPGEEKPIMSIGANNLFEIGSQVHSRKVGDNNVFEPKSYVGRHCEVSSGCTIGALCHVTCRDRLPENCVVFGKDNTRRIAGEKPQTPALQFDYLSQIAPKFHNLKKPKAAMPKP